MQENLSLYHIFYVTGKTGSISRAAKELYISQPAVSRAVQKLEHNLNTLLFKRNSRGVALPLTEKFFLKKYRQPLSLSMKENVPSFITVPETFRSSVSEPVPRSADMFFFPG